MTYMKRLPFTGCLLTALILMPVCVQAVPVSFQWSDTVILPLSPGPLPAGVSVGDPFVLTIVVDNGGSGTASQTWTGVDFVSVSIDVNSGAYTGSDTTITGSSGSFQTDAGSNIVSVPTNWNGIPGTGTDSLGNTGIDWFINGGNGIWLDSPGFSFDIWAANVASNVNPSSWSIASVGSPDTAIPEPVTATLGLMGLGVLSVATRRRAA